MMTCKQGAALVVVLLAGLPVCAQVSSQAGTPQEKAQGKTAAAEAKAAPAVPAQEGGVVVFRDPVTGKIRQPDAAEIGELTKSKGSAAQANAGRHEEIYAAGGAVGLRLDDSMDVYMVVTRNPGGKLSTECVMGRKAAAAKVNSRTAAKRAENRDVE